ncbi:molybdenum cofactor biosynthesis protein [Ktedonobacter sp. SOSP1-85]|uniref:MOSC domain-containing protein n=1 Tax=Ktedonobacter sp. SOSP1-85 TaxID=2778367 RepID=UPI0019158B04|nr:MOSC domain-containing protein [Ktedonobacter sp. SOSP1-85]GHO81364.1 molybdenum cofactor biosynthesis protein [Ktedonobacter sp. SOSP1-85]
MPTMRVISVNVGLPRTVNWEGKEFQTAIYKQPVEGRVRVRKENLEGDRQTDLKNHGGFDKAVYAYSADNYPYWQRELNRDELPWGSFGENLTLTGLNEHEVHIGDIFRIGNATFQITQPRTPCYKLEARLQQERFIKPFQDSGLVGFYLAVLEEGDVAAGDPIELLKRDETSMTIAEVAAVIADKSDLVALRRAAELEHFPPKVRAIFARSLRKKEAAQAR